MRHRRAIFLSLVAALSCAAAVVRAEAPRRQTLVKAAFLYNFGLFVQWPDGTFCSADAPLTIGVVAETGDDSNFCDALTQLVAGKTAGNHPIVVKKCAAGDDLAACQILYIPASQDGHLADVLGGVRAKPVLTVGETDAFLPAGGVIRFISEQNKVRFEINPQAAEYARLRISSKLLKLARIYKPD